MYKNMLVPLDGSTLAEVLISYARRLVSTRSIEIITLNVLPPDERSMFPMSKAYVNHAVENLQAAATGIRVKAKGEVAIERSPVDAIKKYAKKESVDFILMATHGRSGIARFVIGSTAEAVLRESKIPVWLIRAGLSEKRIKASFPLKRIMVLLDGSQRAEAAIPHAEKLVKQFGSKTAEVTLVRVCQDPEVMADYPPNMPKSWEDYIAAERDKCRQSAISYFEAVAGRLEAKGIKVKHEILAGEPAEKIIEHEKKSNYDLIIMATSARSGFSRWVYGSVAETVVKEAETPVFLIRNK